VLVFYVSAPNKEKYEYLVYYFEPYNIGSQILRSRFANEVSAVYDAFKTMPEIEARQVVLQQ
jgi:hypothetical protein